MKKYNNEIFGAICLLAAGFFLSFGGLLIRLVDDATTMQVTSYRSITFCLVALIYILIKFKSDDFSNSSAKVCNSFCVTKLTVLREPLYKSDAVKSVITSI